MRIATRPSCSIPWLTPVKKGPLRTNTHGSMMAVQTPYRLRQVPTIPPSTPHQPSTIGSSNDRQLPLAPRGNHAPCCTHLRRSSGARQRTSPLKRLKPNAPFSEIMFQLILRTTEKLTQGTKPLNSHQYHFASRHGSGFLLWIKGRVGEGERSDRVSKLTTRTSQALPAGTPNREIMLPGKELLNFAPISIS